MDKTKQFAKAFVWLAAGFLIAVFVTVLSNLNRQVPHFKSGQDAPKGLLQLKVPSRFVPARNTAQIASSSANEELTIASKSNRTAMLLNNILLLPHFINSIQRSILIHRPTQKIGIFSAGGSLLMLLSLAPLVLKARAQQRLSPKSKGARQQTDAIEKDQIFDTVNEHSSPQSKPKQSVFWPLID